MLKPKKLHLHKQSKQLELAYTDGEFQLSCEFLRVHSPSAEVRGHGSPMLQTGKKEVTITNVEPVGQYGLKFTFDDGHDSGIYTWEYLRELCEQQDEYWDKYLDDLHRAGQTREAETGVVKFVP